MIIGQFHANDPGLLMRLVICRSLGGSGSGFDATIRIAEKRRQYHNYEAGNQDLTLKGDTCIHIGNFEISVSVI